MKAASARMLAISFAFFLHLPFASALFAKPTVGPVHAAPTHYGRAYRANRSALVRVRSEQSTKVRENAGFVVGAGGEVVFSGRTSIGRAVAVVDASGTQHAAHVIAYDRDLRLAVARMIDPPTEISPILQTRIEVPRAGEWVVVIKPGKGGVPTPHAGTTSTRAFTRKKGGKASWLFRADVPAVAGSPIFALDGALLGIALDNGRRQTRVLAMRTLEPFLRAAVLVDQRTP